jgi:hypothetical protein
MAAGAGSAVGGGGGGSASAGGGSGGDLVDDAPREYCDPITHELMRDPVTLSDGHTYERTSITAWLAGHDTSPLSGTVVTKVMTPNHTLRSLIQSYVAEFEKRQAASAGPLVSIDGTREAEAVKLLMYKKYGSSEPADESILVTAVHKVRHCGPGILGLEVHVCAKPLLGPLGPAG